MENETFDDYYRRKHEFLKEYRAIGDCYGRGINEHGVVINLESTKAYKPYVASKYLCIKLYSLSLKKRRTYLVHRLVYEAFHGPIPKGMWINHRDGDKLNNHISNLELTTPQQNHIHARDVLKRRWAKGDENAKSLLSELDRKAIKDLKSLGWSNEKLSQIFMVSTASIAKYL